MVPRSLLCSRKLLFLYQQKPLTRASYFQRLYSTQLSTSFKDSLSDYAITKDINALVKHLPTSGSQNEMVPIYNTALSKCVRKGELGHIQQIIDLMKKRGVQVDTATQNILMRLRLSKRGIKQEEAFKIYQDMLSQSIKPNTATFNTFIKYACQHHHWDALPQWLKLMKQHSIEPNRITAQTIFRCLVVDPTNTVLLEAFDSVSPIVSFDKESFLNAGIVALIKDNKTTLALELLNTLFEKEMPRSTYSYNIMVTALCRQGDLKTARNILNAMIHNSKIPNPDIITFTSLIHGIIKCGGDEKEQLSSIVDIYTKLLSFGLRSNNVLNSVLLSYFIKRSSIRKPEAIETMCEIVLNNKKKVRLPRQHGDIELIEMHIYNMMIDFCFTRSRSQKQTSLPKQPFLLLRHAIEQRKLKPTTSTLNIFVRGFADYHHDLNTAEKVLDFLVHRGVKMNERTVWLLVKSALKQNKIERARYWIVEYEKDHCIKGDGLLWFKSQIMKWENDKDSAHV
ncbi:hypothetical protein G6F46_010688 [Rhizopus delemar]|uniref:Pentacotripeptide-repeat region of PRORP domain-containing protein n=2 Tax=Rhizopus TaxID=4842 RepID=A0A9P6Z036_9FUNG|nr:hypothetical protein G6F55_009912 [Rhizopus delemar]KAG1536823.1 hypothetical protein G6F51_010742 [Rhizopus arrhizus]KAG1491094.1 hypothetical protein G6F54_010263 [Rhizopus delemar]KAG1504981.1 hypothetical protein G6F53_010283 [Rhizopus delemar]KAG1520218.1 hypothetical protein G6F52_007875 [Rhizopus delemar]